MRPLMPCQPIPIKPHRTLQRLPGNGDRPRPPPSLRREPSQQHHQLPPPLFIAGEQLPKIQRQVVRLANPGPRVHRPEPRPLLRHDALDRPPHISPQARRCATTSTADHSPAAGATRSSSAVIPSVTLAIRAGCATSSARISSGESSLEAMAIVSVPNTSKAAA